jgi:hypothetical protein
LATSLSATSQETTMTPVANNDIVYGENNDGCC